MLMLEAAGEPLMEASIEADLRARNLQDDVPRLLRDLGGMGMVTKTAAGGWILTDKGRSRITGSRT